MRRMTASLIAIALALSQASATADPGCFGCNVGDSGRYTQNLVGTRVYVEGGVGSWGTVERVDSSGYAIVRLSDGRAVQAHYSHIYSRASREERVAGGTTAAVVGAAILICMFGGCQDNRGSSSSSNTSSRSSSGTDTRRYDPADYGGSSRTYSPPPPPPPPQPCTSGLYGNCHGGSVYSHPDD